MLVSSANVLKIYMCNGLVKAVEIDPLEFALDTLAIACLENIPGTQVRAGLTGFKILIYLFLYNSLPGSCLLAVFNMAL